VVRNADIHDLRDTTTTRDLYVLDAKATASIATASASSSAAKGSSAFRFWRTSSDDEPGHSLAGGGGRENQAAVGLKRANW